MEIIAVKRCKTNPMLLEFKCPWGCKAKTYHRHGACGSLRFGSGDGSRESHCPHYNGEYYIQEVAE